MAWAGWAHHARSLLQFQGLPQAPGDRSQEGDTGTRPAAPVSARALSTGVRLQAWGPQGRTSPWRQGPHALLSTSSSAQESILLPVLQAPAPASCRAWHSTALTTRTLGVVGAESECEGQRARGRCGLYPTATKQPLPHGAPSPREVPSPLALQGAPQVGDPGCLCLPRAPTMAGAMEPFRGARGHSSPLDGQIPLTALGWHLLLG